MKADGGAFVLNLKDMNAKLKDRNGSFGVAINSFINVPETGDVTFGAKGEGGCQLWLHEAHILEYEKGDLIDGRSITLKLEKGAHPFRLYLTADDGYESLAIPSFLNL
jgi:hypothetical protein